MKNSLLLSIFSALLLSTTFSYSQPLQLTLDESIERAKIHNRAVEIAEFDTLSAIGDKNLVRSALLPHIDAEGVIDNSNKSVSGELTQFQDFKANKALGVKAAVGIWDFGVTWRRFKATKLRIDASEIEREKVCLAVEEEVRMTYLKSLETEKLIGVLENALITLQGQLNLIKDNLSQGFLKPSDLLATQVQLIESEKNLIQLKNTLTAQKMALNRLIGLPLFETISLVDVCNDPPCVDFDQAVQFALNYRPEILAFQKQLEALYLERKALFWSVAPKFYAFANGNTSFPKSTISAGIGMTMPLYHGGEKNAEFQKVSAEIGKLEALIEDANDELVLEVKTLFLQFDEINMNFHLTEKAIALAEQQFFDNQKLYEQDQIPIQNVLFAQDQLNEAKMNYFSNYYRWHQAFARLNAVTGGYPLKTL